MPSATVLSICPFETIEIKPILGGYYSIPAAPKDDFVLVLIRESSYIQRMPATEHNISIPVAAHHIAKSLVDDFVNTVIEADNEAGPGMMWFEGILTKTDVLAKHKDELKALQDKQVRWFKNLCKKADDDWNQYHKVGLISGHQRYAADYLGYKAPWLMDYQPNAGLIDCPSCFSKIDARAVICIHCKAILDKDKALQFGIIPTEQVVANPPQLARK